MNTTKYGRVNKLVSRDIKDNNQVGMSQRQKIFDKILRMKKSSPYSMRSLSNSSVNQSKLGDKDFYQGYDDNVRQKPKLVALRPLISKQKGGVEGLRMKAILSIPRNQGVTITVKPTSVDNRQDYYHRPPAVAGKKHVDARSRSHHERTPTTRSHY